MEKMDGRMIGVLILKQGGHGGKTEFTDGIALVIHVYRQRIHKEKPRSENRGLNRKSFKGFIS